jgi:hypothetical protein
MAPTTANPEAGIIRSLVNSILIFFIGACPLCMLVFAVSIIPESATEVGK